MAVNNIKDMMSYPFALRAIFFHHLSKGAYIHESVNKQSHYLSTIYFKKAPV